MILIYTLNDPITNEVRYIGITSKTLKERLRHHLKDANVFKLKSHKKYWIRQLLDKGMSPIIVLLETCNDYESGLKREIELISEYKSLGYNLVNNTNGGQGTIGLKLTPQQKIEKSLRQTGKKLPSWTEERRKLMISILKGRKMTDEQKEKMRKPKSEIHKKKLRDVNLGKILSKSTKIKMGEARKKEWQNNERKPTRLGAKNSESHKDKMRGENNPFYGKTHSKEMRKFISERVKQALKK